MSLATLFDDAKAKLEQFLGGQVLDNVKTVVDDLKVKLDAAEVVVEDDARKYEAKAEELEAAVKAQADVELKKLEADEPEIKAAVEAALQAVLQAFEAAK